MFLLHSLLMNYPTLQTFIQSKSTSHHAGDMLKTCQWSRILQSSKFFVCLSPSSEIQWDMHHCSGGAAVLSKAVSQTTFCIKIINITGEDEHKKPACIF